MMISVQRFTIVGAFALLVACSSEMPTVQTITQGSLHELAKNLQVTYRVESNLEKEHCKSVPSESRCYRAVYSFSTPKAHAVNNWAIYFSHVDYIQKALTEQFSLEHINGDLYVIKPAMSFNGFEANARYELPFVADLWSVTEGKVMPNFLLVVDGLNAETIQSTIETYQELTGDVRPHFMESLTDPITQRRHGEEDLTPIVNNDWRSAQLREERALATPPDSKASNAKISDTNTSGRKSGADRIIPKVKSLRIPQKGTLSLASGIRIESAFEELSLTSISKQLNFIGVQETSEGVPVQLLHTTNDVIAEEGYSLSIANEGAVIKARHAAGAFYGLQSVLALIDTSQMTLPLAEIVDEPRFAYRGMHLDVGRNFHSKAAVFRLIEQMARYKMNKLHLHLADDEGWRLEIDGLPELTEIGGYRCFDLSETRCLLPQLGAGNERESSINGYYSRADYIEIVQFAHQHFIEIIPSLDMPGHARAAIVSLKAREKRLLAEGNVEEATRYRLYDPDDTSQYLSIQYYTDNTINPCVDSSYTFVRKIVHEVKKLHEQAAVPLRSFHVGADETAGAWLDSPACAAHIQNDKSPEENRHALAVNFMSKVRDILLQSNLRMAAWSDGLESLNTPTTAQPLQAYIWSTLKAGAHSVSHSFANNGHEVVLSIPDVSYFDFPWEAHPKEPGYYWAARHVSLQKVFNFMPENLAAHAEIWRDNNERDFVLDDTPDAAGKRKPLAKDKQFYGIQGQLWSETIRSDERMEYMLFPRLLALAERAWHKAEWELPYVHEGRIYSAKTQHFDEARQQQRARDWWSFKERLAQVELARIESYAVSYRLPLVIAQPRETHWELFTEYGDLPIQYRSENSDWVYYQSPIPRTIDVEMRATSNDGKRYGRVTKVEGIKATTSH